MRWPSTCRSRTCAAPASAAAAFAATDELARTLADVPAPLGTIWGTLDTIARPSLQARLDVLRRHHPELDVRLIEGAGHWVMYEAADQFNAAFLDLLTGAGA